MVKGRRQTRSLTPVVNDRVGDFVQDVPAAGGSHEIGHSDALAGLHQNFGKSKGDNQHTLELGLVRER